MLTFNCLVQRFTFSDKYPNSNPEDLVWTNRFARFVDIITKSDADVVCLQEIDESLFASDWQPFFNQHGYEAHYQKKIKWGNVTAFKTDKFTLEWIDHRSRVLLCLLRLSANSHPIYVANAHLSAEASKAEERINQVKSVFKQIEKHQQGLELTVENSSIVFCGDLNSMPQSGLYKLFTEGKLSAEYRDENSDTSYTKCDLRLPTCLISSYCAHFNSEPTWTYSYQNKWTDTLDYVFYSPQCVEVVHVDEIDNTKVGKNIPNAVMPSDHVPMVVELKVRVSAIRRPMNPSA
jgi:CCR4-NOT transcription complex subunit 6